MTLQVDHQDYGVLSTIAADILNRAGGHAAFDAWLRQMLREKIDAVINTPETKRRSFAEAEVFSYTPVKVITLRRRPQ
jgi:hypothetical protein